MLIVNADDLGRSRAETDAAIACYRQGRVTSLSAMVFMEDSERAANLAKDEGVEDIGLHINFSQRFTGHLGEGALRRRHERVVRFLLLSKYALILYNPTLHLDFRSDYKSQVIEFQRLYGKPPSHFDGHQHMHLCTNMLLSGAVPRGARVRRSFSFRAGERGFANRSYRRVVDKWLARRYRLTDFFFALSQNLDAGHLKRIRDLAKNAVVELMTHPVKPDEYAFLVSDGYLSMLGDLGSFPIETTKCLLKSLL